MRKETRLVILPIAAAAVWLLLCFLLTRTAASAQAGHQRQINPNKHAQAAPTLTDEELRKLIDREFDGLFVPDQLTISPAYIVGDFNGDGVWDIAVPVKLVRNIDQGDQTEPPFWVHKPWACSGKSTPEKDYDDRFTFGRLAGYGSHNGPMLAVIHGTAEHGWRVSQRPQRFLIVDAWQVHKKVMRLFRGRLKPAFIGAEPQIARLPRLKGDAIIMEHAEGSDPESTAVVFDGLGYCCFPFENAKK